jgi:ligand-binding sensor domain-containing protein
VKFGTKLSDATKWTTVDGLPSNRINNIFIDKDGSLWIATDLGASHFDGSRFLNIRTSDYAKNYFKFKQLVKKHL